MELVFILVFAPLSLALIKGKRLDLGLLSGAILLSPAYELVMNRGLNYIMLLFGAPVAWQLPSLQKRGEIK